MRLRSLALTLLAAAVLVVVPAASSLGGGDGSPAARPLTHAARLLGPAVEAAGPNSTPLEQSAEPEEPSNLAHRQSVLERFPCSKCHLVGGLWALPDDHKSYPEGDCQSCHARVPEPKPAALHSLVETEGAPSQALCAFCHGDIAGPIVLSPEGVSDGAECETCHSQPDDPALLPDGHEGRTATTCMVCHETSFLESPPVGHRLSEGWQECSFCHGQGRLGALSGGHKGIEDSECQQCHAATKKPPRPPERMLDLAEEKEGCASCHAPGGVAPPPPKEHEGREEVLCGVCHQAVHDKAPTVPHSLTGAGACEGCHTAAKAGAPPLEHPLEVDEAHPASMEACATCHLEVPGGVPAIPHPVQNRATCTNCHATLDASEPGG